MNMQPCLTMPPILDADDISVRGRSLVVAMVVLVHVLLFWSYNSLSSQSRSTFREMSISMVAPSISETAKVEPRPEVKPKPVKQQSVQEVTEPESSAEVPSLPAESAQVQPENVAPSLPDREPDYQAAYLNNPKPGYPMVARRMGWQGKVMLEVEVLESGIPGEVRLHQSSGRDVLDNAAIQTVRNWRFVAARKNGQVAAQRIFVPINFNLKVSE